MAILQLPLPAIYINAPTSTTTSTMPRRRLRVSSLPSLVTCMAATTNMTSDHTTVRRSANYMPSLWSHDYLLSLDNKYGRGVKVEIERLERMKEEVKKTLDETEGPLDKLQLIDTMQRLGVSYHFQDEIEKTLENIYDSGKDTVGNSWRKEDLHAAALEFRLLRQHGFNVGQEVFDGFKDSTGRLRASLRDNIEALLSLYDASFLSTEGEATLKEARVFATEHLRQFVAKNIETEGNESSYLKSIVNHALEMPFHWRMRRLESRWYIDMYGKRQDANTVLLEFAKMDFNMVQAQHQEDLKYASSWWRNTDIGEKLKFVRDRLMESFLFTVGFFYEPQFGYCRRMITKINLLVTIIDDTYDIYGTIEELELFTQTVEKWDVNRLEQLPEYLRLPFLALYSSINQIGFDVLRDKGFLVIPYLKKAWTDICKAYLREAKWYHSGYKPSLGEYMENAWVSISAPVILVHAFCFLSDQISKDTLDSLSEYHQIIRWSGTIARLANDLATSSDELKRGDIPKAVQCHMHETGATEEEARDHIHSLISDAWDKMNEEKMASSSPFSQRFIEAAMNVARVAQFMYQSGDGFGAPGKEIKDCALSLFVHPIPLQ